MAGERVVAIIGAGMAGLAAALRLRARGAAVRLFEARSKIGGCCATTRIDGYTFNDGAVYIAMPELLDRLFAAVAVERPPLCRIVAIQSATLPDGTLVDIRAEGDGVTVTERGPAASPRTQAEVRAFVRAWEPTLRYFADEVLVRPLSLPALLAKGWRHLAKLHGTVSSHLVRSFSSEAVRAALGGALLYTGAPPERMSAASLLPLVAMLRDGYVLPDGGMGRIPEALANAVRARGGEIHLDAAVRRILVKDGRAFGLELERGGVVEADAVLSTVSAMHTYGSLLCEGDAPARMRRKVRRVPLSHRGFALQLGLTGRIDARCHVNAVLPWLADQGKVFEPVDGRLHWPIYTVPTLTLPGLAPEGCSIVEMFPPVDQHRTPDAWSEAHKAQVAARAMERLRRDHGIDIAVRRASSPRGFPRRPASLGGRAVRRLAARRAGRTVQPPHADPQLVPGRADNLAGIRRRHLGAFRRVRRRSAGTRPTALKFGCPSRSSRVFQARKPAVSTTPSSTSASISASP